MDKNKFIEIFNDRKKKIFESYSARVQESNSIILGGDDLDNAQMMSFKYETEIFSARDHSTLRKIESALKRIEDDTFGICKECEEDIGYNRLIAIPDAELCIGCAEHNERLSKQYVR